MCATPNRTNPPAAVAFTLAFALAGSLLADHAPAQEIVTPTAMKVERFAVGGVSRKNTPLDRFDEITDAPAPTRVVEYVHPAPTTYLRVVLEGINLFAGQSITIHGISDAPLDIIEGPMGGDSGLRWYSAIIPGDRARITVTGESLDGAAVTLRDVAFQNSAGKVKSIFGVDDRQPFSELADDPAIAGIGNSVAFLSILGIGNVPRTCTGFLINDRQLLTNQHCYLDLPRECETTAIMFGYEHAVPKGEQFRCAAVTPEHGIVDGAFVLDYAIVELDRPVSGTRTPIALHTLETMAVPEPEQPHDPLQPLGRIDAVMIHHPAGEEKQVTRTNCRVFRERIEGANGADDFRHRCDTLVGSSGSPIIVLEAEPSGNGAFCAAGLHHAAFADSGPFKDYNRAVNMPLISEKLAANGIDFSTCTSHTFSIIE